LDSVKCGTTSKGGFVAVARLERLVRSVPVDVVDEPPGRGALVLSRLEYVSGFGNAYGLVVVSRGDLYVKLACGAYGLGRCNYASPSASDPRSGIVSIYIF
jgi:hypothetical protein